MPIGWAIVVIVQWLAIISLTAVVLGVLRQVTPRLEAPAGPQRPRLRDQGPAVGTRMPVFRARDKGSEIISAELLAGQPSTLLFASASCGPCMKLARELGTVPPPAELAGSLIVVTDPDGAETLNLPSWLRLVTMPDGECAQVLGIQGRPFAMTVDADEIVTAKRPVNTVAQLTSVAAAAVPSPVPPVDAPVA
jgi:hypothetical protein